MTLTWPEEVEAAAEWESNASPGRGMLLTAGRPHFRFFFLWLPFFPFLHLLAEATGPVFELAGMASVPPARAATSAASVILLISTDTPIDSACWATQSSLRGRSGQKS